MVKSVSSPHQSLAPNSKIILNVKLEAHVDYHSIDHMKEYKFCIWS